MGCSDEGSQGREGGGGGGGGKSGIGDAMPPFGVYVVVKTCASGLDFGQFARCRYSMDGYGFAKVGGGRGMRMGRGSIKI